MEKVITFNIGGSKLQSIYKICSQMRIGVIVVSKEQEGLTVEELLKNPLYKGGEVAVGDGNSLVLMCELTQKHMDKLLSSIRSSKLEVDYKAILTPTNRKWNSVKLLAHMAFEKGWLTDFTKTAYRTGEAAKILGITTRTIQNYDKLGKLKVCRTEGNRRVIMREDLIKYLDDKGLIYDDTNSKRHDVIYARVSSNEQKQSGDLDRQALYLVENAKDIQNPIILKEVGSGLNDKRKQLQKLLGMISNHEVRNVYITYKDRLTRFGFNYLETMFNACGTSIIVLQDESNEKTVHDELVEDMISIISKTNIFDELVEKIKQDENLKVL